MPESKTKTCPDCGQPDVREDDGRHDASTCLKHVLEQREAALKLVREGLSLVADPTPYFPKGPVSVWQIQNFSTSVQRPLRLALKMLTPNKTTYGSLKTKNKSA